ncbi:ribose ABC transporter substrate-binding protein [Thioclava sp. JM3]|uniref:substrate-binding domain-containing protein n=1 Tax=unclassified Thioclava TaxID=2621713 RepID=UPI0009987C22|nr:MULTISPECIES: substrate-binding domain-containing protein [unclassified Thioclava]OOY07809.1 ribose ABC transporter substrate-binding protein [Thioclava sp. F36-7]OWY04609.1 ribose ABC transporter substrate-binding protein [Thioclava sp. F1Mire-8]OWY09313.1 ribose ABC transporter substrate-binding protein [Thioclava sp. F34-6]OWY15004.1 ribose ABC transporter substrate-binding protein [Thioclava sp. JM3]PWE48797.1 ribose ABC transporter substrate-binding protein [Thioclava sp. NG1]
MKLSNLKGCAAYMALGLGIALSASAASAEDAPSWCGPNKASLALLDGFGGNSWRLVTTASGKEEAAKCPSITDYYYADGQGDTQKAISDINSMAARGVDAMVVFGDAGPAILPALTKAYRSGAVVVPYRVNVGGEAGKNYTRFVGADFVYDGESWGKWIKENFPDGANILFLSGPAGNSQGLDELKGMKNILDDSYKFLNPDPFAVTNWDPSLTQQVLSAAIAQHDNIDVIVSDFGPSLVGALPVFANFDRSIPALATSDGNSLGCFWEKVHADNPDFKLFTVATGNDNVRLAVQWAIAEATGGTPPSEEVFKAPNFEDSTDGDPNPVQCRSDLPGAIYLSAQLSGDEQAKAVGQ